MSMRLLNGALVLAAFLPLLPQRASAQGKTSTRPAEPFTAKSVWVNEKTTLTVVERKGASFRATLVIGDSIERDISGTVKDGKVTWLATDVRPVKGGRGSDNYGTISGDRIDFAYRHPNGMTRAYTLRRSETRAAKQGAPAPSSGGNPQSYVILWDFDATKGTAEPTGEILIPAPADEPYQKTRWEVSGVRSQRVLSVEGGRVIAVRPDGKSFRLRVVVEPTASEIPKPSGTVPVPADALACLRHTAAFAARNPRTAKLARALKAAEPAETVQNIRQWINKNMKYRYNSFRNWDDIGVIDSILQAKLGGCGAYAELFVGLSRQAGIPARVVFGTYKTGFTKPPPNDDSGLPSELGDIGSHYWAEVYLKGWGWIPVEPQDAETPLGRVPKDYALFTRHSSANDGTHRQTDMAAVNVFNMNFFPRLEQADAGGATKGKVSQSKPSPPKKK